MLDRQLLRGALRRWLQQPPAPRCCPGASPLQALPGLGLHALPAARPAPQPRRPPALAARATVEQLQQEPAAAAAAAESRAGEASGSSRRDFCVVNFYHLTALPRPHGIVRAHREWLRGRDVLGRIYITSQGINAQLSGPRADAHAYAEWVARQPGFEGLRWTSDPTDRHQFPRLRLKHRDSLVQLAGGTQALPLTDPEARARPLAPREWQELLRDAERSQTKPVVLDVRNAYEWDAGHFAGAERPVEEQFNQTPTEAAPGVLRGAPKDAPVLMYCTGGIRCDVYSALLRERGYSNLFTLEGGVAAYLRELGPGAWRGSLFTFDDRMALAPDGEVLRDANLAAAAPCAGCGGTASLPHLNCANVDCNRLFLACPACQERLRGCCCAECIDAPRLLRPARGAGHYRAWHEAADPADLERLKEAMRAGRGGGRAAKRQRRLARLKAKHAEVREQRARRRELVKVALAARAEGELEQEPAGVAA